MTLTPLRRGFCRCVNSLTRVVSLFWRLLGYDVTTRIAWGMWANRLSSVKFFFCQLTFCYSFTDICNICNIFAWDPWHYGRIMLVAPLTPPESKTKNYFCPYHRPTHHVQTHVKLEYSPRYISAVIRLRYHKLLQNGNNTHENTTKKGKYFRCKTDDCKIVDKKWK